MADELIARLCEWASQHSNVTPLDGTDRNSPTFGDLRELLARIEPEAADRGVSEAGDKLFDDVCRLLERTPPTSAGVRGFVAQQIIDRIRSEQEGGHD